MNYIFYYCDYYFIFILTFFFLIVILNFKFYLFFKQKKEIFLNKSKLIFLNFKIALIFIIINILSFNINISKIFILNYIILYKLIFIIFIFMFIILLFEFSKKFKWFNLEYLIVFIFSSFCLFLLIQCNNFLSFYVVLESYSLTICSVFVLKKLSKKLVDASFKYLIINILSSCLIILGISNIYFSSGLLNFSEISQSLIFFKFFVFKNVFYFGYILIFLGFSIKLTIFPFSLILAEIYNSFNSVFAFFLLIIPKFSFTFFFYYLTSYLIIFDNFKVFILFYFLSLITSLIHAILAINSLKLKNIIINTSFSNVPFIVFCIFFKSTFSLVVFINFIFIYFLNLFCFFCLFFIICNSKKYFIKKITALISLWYTNNSLSLLFFINLVSLASLPPFSGFFAKLYIFYLLVEYKMFAIYLFLSFVNLIIVFCYLRIIKIFFIKNKNIFLKYIFIKKNIIIFMLSFISFLNIFFLYFFDTFFYYIFILLNNAIIY